MLANDVKLREESHLVRDRQQVERLDLLVHGLYLQTDVNVEQFAAGNLLNVTPPQDQLLFLAQNSLLLDIDLIRRCV